MSISSDLLRIKAAKSDSFDAVAAKGVTVPEGAKIDSLPNLIAQISDGGSGGGDGFFAGVSASAETVTILLAETDTVYFDFGWMAMTSALAEEYTP